MSNPKQKACFIIHLDCSPYNERDDNVFTPAIESANLCVCYIEGPGIINTIEKIEKGIRLADICFADVSENDINVWYAVGFAFACGKNVAIVCNADSLNSDTLFFGVQPEDVILYKESIDSNNFDNQDVIELRSEIACRVEKLSEIPSPFTPQPSVEGNISIIFGDLTREDFVLLLKIMKQYVKKGHSSYYNLSGKNRQKNIQEDLLVSILNLTNKGYVVEDWTLIKGKSHYSLRCTDKAMVLFLNNKELLFNM